MYYRGLDSLLWSIYNKDFTNLCTCLHFVDEGLDTGNIVFKKKIIINNKTKLKELRSINTLNTIYLYKKFIQLKKVKFKKQNRIGKYYSAFPSSKINICIKNIKNYEKNKYFKKNTFSIFLFHGVVKNNFNIRNYNKKHILENHFYRFLKKIKQEAEVYSIESITKKLT